MSNLVRNATPKSAEPTHNQLLRCTWCLQELITDLAIIHPLKECSCKGIHISIETSKVVGRRNPIDTINNPGARLGLATGD